MAMVVTVAAMGVMVAAMGVMEVMVGWEVMEGTVGMDHMEWVIDEFMKVMVEWEVWEDLKIKKVFYSTPWSLYKVLVF